MSELTITQVQPAGTWTTPQQETLYKQEVTFSDNVSCIIFSPKENKWKVGDDITVTKESQHNGKVKRSIGLTKDVEKKMNRNANFEKRDERVGRQWAINTAITYLQLVTTAEGQMTYNEVAHVARMFDKMRNEFDTFKLADGEDLPF